MMTVLHWVFFFTFTALVLCLQSGAFQMVLHGCSNYDEASANSRWMKVQMCFSGPVGSLLELFLFLKNLLSRRH